MKVRQVTNVVGSVQSNMKNNTKAIVKVIEKVIEVKKEMDMFQMNIEKFTGGKNDIKLMLQQLVTNMVVQEKETVKNDSA